MDDEIQVFLDMFYREPDPLPACRALDTAISGCGAM